MKSTLFYSIAQAEAPKKEAKKPSFIEQSVPFLFIFAIIYFLLIRPNQKRMKAHTTFTQGLKKGDKVLTQGGILGTIVGTTDQYITLEISQDVTIRVLRSHVSSFADLQQTSKNPLSKNQSKRDISAH